MTFYYKRTGFDEFYRISGTVRLSHRGNRILTVEECTPITKYRYYEHCAPCFSLSLVCRPGDDIHELNFRHLPWPKI